MRVLGEKTIAGVDGLDIGNLRSADDACDVQIALGRRSRADADGFVGQMQIWGVAVGFTEDRDDFNAEVFASANDAQGDFAAIGHENALEHRWFPNY